MMISKLENIDFDIHFGIQDEPPSESRISYPKERKGFSSYISIDGDQIIGVLVVSPSRSGKTVFSSGTVVRPSRRKEGIARKLWITMIKSEKPERVAVKVISDRGLSLIESVKQEFPKIKWFINEDGRRKLRRMKLEQ